MAYVHEFQVKRLDGALTPFQTFTGKVMLIVNTASECGFTPQYEALERLHRAYHERGLAVLGFPCDQFGHQEPGSAEEIGQFCETHYGLTFPIFEKIEVNGANAHPLFRWLKKEARGVLGSERIKWNFTKFLIDRSGQVVKRFAPATKPEALESHIQRLL